MKVLVDTRWIAPHGIGRFAAEVINRLPEYEPLPNGPSKLGFVDPLWLSYTISRLRPQVYFSPGFNPPLRCAAPFIFTIHDLIHIDVAEECNMTKKLYYRSIVRPAIKQAFRILTVSNYSKQRIISWANVSEEKVIVVGNGVSSGFITDGPRQDRDKPYLLFVGNSKPHKNLERLLAAYARSGISDDVELVLCAPNEPRIHDWINKNGLQGKVFITGILSGSDLACYYRGAVGLLFPSLYEGFGLPVLEAMACGTVVLSSAVTAIPEVTGDAALFIEPSDVDSIADGMKRLAADDELRNDLRRRGLERADMFSWDRTAEVIWQVILQAAASR
ncbi:glycosyltransferase family 4 protein [bacterium]|nr:glycosyltransferase family 4 protein [bacterium]